MIHLPYVVQKRKTLQLPSNYPALVIYDTFAAQGTEDVLKLLEKNNIYIVMVPANCTDRLQPLDVSVNKPAKDFLREQFHEWYSEQVCQKIEQNTTGTPVDLRLSVMKPLGAQWMIKLIDNLHSKPEIIINGFKKTGIVDCLDEQCQ